MSERNFRIRTNVSKDKVVRVNLSQDYDFLEILSLKINQADTYKLHVSDYGVIVGRVLANENFGIPNAKVSVFIELDDNDSSNSEVINMYPYKSIHDRNDEGVRYNLLPDQSNDECYKIVGTFPNKRVVLDDDTQIEIFDKYWKYTTVTNKSGDYMIYGVPTGNQNIHVDIDLSDIGILSQKPIDFMYKGYNETQFDNARQFKDSKNLDNLSQILSQDNSVNVYPFWGDKNVEEIAITRCDIQVQYKFETTCVFFGSIISDNYNNNIGHKCSPSKHAGFNRHLVTGEGTIEMIRKTPDNLVEEFQIQGNRLIDSDGVWCYQIPMNLDYVGTDEFGNIVPTDDVKKGIATRTSVRFRVSMQETNNEGVSRHRAKYLIPNVQKVVPGSDSDCTPHMENCNLFDQCYEFGSATPDEYFRDLYWNKVYSVKNYIPRLQTNGKRNTQNYSAIRTVNSNGNLNPVPFNHARYRLVYGYRILCMLMTIVIFIITVVNQLISAIICDFCLPKIPLVGRICPLGWLGRFIHCIGISGGLSEDEEANKEYFPGCSRHCKHNMMRCKEEKDCIRETDPDKLMNVVQQTLSQEYDTVNLDFYNDWLNGSLYLPLWYWKKTKKKKFLFGLFSKKAVNTYCSCSNHYSRLRVTQNCSLAFNKNRFTMETNINGEKYHDLFPAHSPFTYFGVIKEFKNKDGLNIYYYAPGLPNTFDYKVNTEKSSYVRLYSTDIILLGSLNSCDLDNYPNVFTNLPSTTANVPFIATIRNYNDDNSEGYVEVTGMDWLDEGKKGKPKYGAGLFIDLACNYVNTKPKSCINAERLSELGVSYDAHENVPIPKNGNLIYEGKESDGLITRFEINDHETRAMFASLNNNGLDEKIFNPNTGYSTYKLRYVYPIDFNGHLDREARDYTSMMPVKTYDVQDWSYVEYKFGLGRNKKMLFYSHEDGDKYSFPLYNNSFYFYFGLNEGNTAIDKFNKKFYASCYRNYKYPFIINVTNTPGKWCVNDQINDYGTIEATITGIKIPYSYTLYNEFNEELVSEDNMSVETLRFGYDIIAGGGSYAQNANGGYIKNGKLKYFNTGEEVKLQNGKNVFLENGVYRLKITDVNGNSSSQLINIEQFKINMVYNYTSLGEKYYEGITTQSDFCSDPNKYGELNINKIVIDGIEYNITNVEGSDGDYFITLGNGGGNVKIIIEGIDKDFSECTCNSSNIFNGKIIKIKFWVPGQYKITLQQYCKGELNDNIFNEVITINNGEPFNAFINDVPIRFILGKNEDVDNYNKKLYDKYCNRTLSEGDLDGWFKLNDEYTYKFDKVDKAHSDIWSDFVDVFLEEDYFDNETINEIVSYKFNSMMTLCRSFYITDDDNYKMFITHKGGKGVILYKGLYPKYDEISDDGTISEYVNDSLGFVSTQVSHPNIVSFNYTRYNSDLKIPEHVITNNEYIPSLIVSDERRDYNRLIWPDTYKKQGNYFAAFTNNACHEAQGECKFVEYPYDSNPEADSIEGVCAYNAPYNKYFRGQFIDKRMDYSFLILTPYSGNEIKKITNDNNKDWMLGRVSGNTFNGVEMAYDNQKSYNIVGDGLEYNVVIDYKKEGVNNIELINDISNRKFYSAMLKSGNEKYNIVNFMQGKAGELNGIEFKEIEGSITKNVNDYPMVRGFDANKIPSSSKVSFECKNCSYDGKFGVYLDDDNKPIATGTSEESKGGIEFEVSSKNMIKNQLKSLMECSANDEYNVKFICSNGNFASNWFKIEFKLNRDEVDKGHLQYTSCPQLFNVTDSRGNTNYINVVKESTKIETLIKNLRDYTLSKFNYHTDSSEVYETYDPLNYGYISNKFITTFGRFNNGDTPLFDDSTEFKNMTFDISLKLENKKILSIYFIRNYVNSEQDNLTKELCSLQFTSLFDVRPFKMECKEYYLVEISDSMLPVPPTPPTPPSGETDNHPTTIDETQTSNSGSTLVQYVKYSIKIEDDVNYNHQFLDTSKISAVIRINDKTANNVVITSEEKPLKDSNGKPVLDKEGNQVIEKYVYLHTYWSGDLSGYFITNKKKITDDDNDPSNDKFEEEPGIKSKDYIVSLFLQMPSKLIYKLIFLQKTNGDLDLHLKLPFF